MFGTMDMRPCTSPTKTIVLKSPDSDRVREVIVTSVLLPKSGSEGNRTQKMSLGIEDYYIAVRRGSKRRLDHLSLEEKILRKKLKNREAAQTSRDRKKARLEELEATVQHLQSENERLHEEVHSLKDEKDVLTRENSRLIEEVWRLSVSGGPSGPAVFCPLPKGVRPPPALPLLPLSLIRRVSLLLHLPLHLHLQLLLAFLLSASMSGTGSTQHPSPLLSKSLNNLPIRSLLKLLVLKRQKSRKKTWWGRRQKAWNPVGHL